MPTSVDLAPGEAQAALTDLPDEIILHILSYIPPQILFHKFIDRSRLKSANRLQLLVLQLTTELLVIRTTPPKPISYDLLSIFHPRDVLKDALTFRSFQEGYPILRDLLFLSIENNMNFLRHTALNFHVGKGDVNIETEMEYFMRTLELFNFGTLTDQITVTLQIIFDEVPKVSGHTLYAIMERVVIISSHISKILIQNRFNIESPTVMLPPLHHSHFEKLQELKLYNTFLNDKHLRRFRELANKPTLEVLDLTANPLSDPTELPLAPNLKKLYLNGNVIETLNGVDFARTQKLEVLEVSLNRLTQLDNIQFPPSLRVFRCSFNSLTNLSQVKLPFSLEELSLANNCIKHLDNVVLPPRLKVLDLGSNNLSTLNDQLVNCPHLTSLCLNDNQFDDFDELGTLPDSLEELVLDNNPVDYNDLTNILRPNLRHLSLYGCGLMSLTHVKFPDSLVKLNLGGNELQELSYVKFGGENLRHLLLSGSDIRSFKFAQDSLSITAHLEELDLSDNPIASFDDVDFPAWAENLNISGWELTSLKIDTAKLPKNLEVLCMNECFDNYERWDGIGSNVGSTVTEHVTTRVVVTDVVSSGGTLLLSATELGSALPDKLSKVTESRHFRRGERGRVVVTGVDFIVPHLDGVSGTARSDGQVLTVRATGVGQTARTTVLAGVVFGERGQLGVPGQRSSRVEGSVLVVGVQHGLLERAVTAGRSSGWSRLWLFLLGGWLRLWSLLGGWLWFWLLLSGLLLRLFLRLLLFFSSWGWSGSWGGRGRLSNESGGVWSELHGFSAVVRRGSGFAGEVGRVGAVRDVQNRGSEKVTVSVVEHGDHDDVVRAGSLWGFHWGAWSGAVLVHSVNLSLGNDMNISS